MNINKYILINSLPLDIISGGNIYNQNLCESFSEKGIEIEYIFTKNIEQTILQIDDNFVILVDSFCLNEKTNWHNLLNKKIILLLHLAPSADDQKNKEKLLEIIETEKIVFKNFPILTAGKKAIEYIEEKYHYSIENYAVIPPAVKSNWKKKKKYNKLPKKLLVIGTITKRKGYFRLIEVLSQLKQLEWTCDCYGNVSDENLLIEIQNLILENQLENRIHFCGTIDNNEMDALQNQYDLLLQLSDEENNSVALIEAIASGLPFISTPTGNYNYFKEKNCGFIVSTFENDTIAQEIFPFLSNKEQYYSLIQSVKNGFIKTWDETIDTIINFTNKQWQ